MRANFDLGVFQEMIFLAIIRHDLPFQFVKYEGIRAAFRCIHKGIILVSRNIAKDYILMIHKREKGRIRELLHSIPGRISLTLDLLTSVCTDGYISLTAHFVDCDWKF
ncbi:hypothetical protein AQUCO_01100028v1 [Aquilegia coerulea]|uniref:Uncharacterized protein n=1 Tax=Aquilegia coerulea TaxID=218851 RepID=A0A2G5E5W3_AQUCA|nr:hypothetical protein AQUCO_01100028v1 [Aquilegia coerulea]